MANVFDTVEESIKQYNRLRRDVGAPESIVSDPLAEEYFQESLERYPVDVSKMIAYTRVIALRGIRGSAALLGKYAQNQSTEDLTKVFDNLTVMLNDAIAEVGIVSDPITSDQTPFFFGAAPGTRGQ